MRQIFVHDLRVMGRTAPSHASNFDVDQTTPLSYFVTRTLSEAAIYNDDVQLIIFAHGYEYHDARGGGYGVQFCREDLQLNTIGQLTPLRGHIHGGIVLLSCAVAHIGQPGGRGDGNILCSRIAQVTGTCVTGSTMSQTYTQIGGSRLQKAFAVPDAWRGTVLTYGPTGAVELIQKHRV